MKPEQLLDAMEHISQDYIAEAKPKNELHQESRVEQQARSAAETVTLKPTQQKSQRSGKDITMSNHSFGQRIMTGVIAAAACAVFVGGGIFIAMQARQNRPETANSGFENSEIKEITDRNFLGGEGEIHVMLDMETMYDDTNFYFSRGYYVAPRSSESLTEMREVSEKQKEYLSHVFYDGEQFYFADGNALYRMDDHGKREDTPFFTAPDEVLPGSPGFTEIQKLNDDVYAFNYMIASASHDTDSCIIYNTETKQSEILTSAPGSLEFVQGTDENIMYLLFSDDCISRLSLNTLQNETIDTANHGYAFRAYAPRAYMAQGDTLYYMSEKWTNGGRAEQDSYGKIDLTTGEYTEIDADPDFDGFITDGDKLFAVVNADTQLVCTDPEWTAPETLYDFDTAEIPERFRGEMQFKTPCCADENYIYLDVGANADLDRALLFDRKTGKMLYFYLPVSDQSAQETDGSNLFGGTGVIRPACMNNTGYSMFFFRDDAYYYVLIGNQWYRFAPDGGSGEPLPGRVNGAGLPDQGFLTDGENILTTNLVPVTGGKMYPSIEEIRSMLNPETHSDNDFINPVSIFHVSDKYFMFLRTENPEDYGTYKVFLWLDKDGNLLDISEEKDPIEEFGGCFTDVENEHVYYWCNGIGDVQNPGQSVTIRELPAPGQTADYQTPTDCAGFCCISGGKTLYFNANGALCGMEDGKQSILCEGLGSFSSSFVLNDQLYYMDMAENYYVPHDSNCLMMIDLNAASPYPVVIMQSEQKNEAGLLGWTDNGGHYEIVLMETAAKRILFIDPETQSIIRELQIPNASGDADNASDEDEAIKSRALDATNAFIDYITNKNEAAAENLSILDQYLLKDGSAYEDMHNIIGDVIWNNAYTKRLDREMSVTNLSMGDENTGICDVRFDYQLLREDGSAQDNAGKIRWTFVKDGEEWKASAYSLSPSDNANSTASAQQNKELTDVSGSNFHGKLLKIKDPSRVYLGVSGSFGETDEGKQVKAMAAEYGAYAAINAGGFEDPDGIGNGGTPLGIVISQGKLLWGDLNETYDLIGFDKDNVLHAGSMTGKQAVDLGIRDAVSYSPILIADGKSVLNETESNDFRMPRTAIGQTADGTVLLLVIEGRQADSLGATNQEIIDIMLENGAVTAANLTGGGCSHMICNNEMVTASPTMNGPRKLPDCWLVAPES